MEPDDMSFMYMRPSQAFFNLQLDEIRFASEDRRQFARTEKTLRGLVVTRAFTRPC